MSTAESAGATEATESTKTTSARGRRGKRRKNGPEEVEASEQTADERLQEEIRTTRDVLRRDFPSVGILHDPWTGRWKAVWGRDSYAETETADELRQQLGGS